MKNLLFVLSLIILVVACKEDEVVPAVIQGVPNSTELMTDDVYDIYHSIYITKSSMSYVVNNTSTYLNCADLEMLELDSIKVTADVLKECDLLNEKAYLIEADKLIGGGVIILNQEEITARPMEEVLEQYGGITYLGHPVIYDNGTRALVEMENYCGNLCASYIIHYLEKNGEFWMPKGTYRRKVSK